MKSAKPLSRHALRRISGAAREDRGFFAGFSPLGGLALIGQQVEHEIAAAETAQHGMGLSAMVRLVIEEMIERRHQRLDELVGRAHTAIADTAGQAGVVEAS